jgi:hypothetical protein
MGPRYRIYLDEAAGYGRNGDSTEASNTVIEAPEELSKCASQYTPASLYGLGKAELLDADRARCIGLTKRQSESRNCCRTVPPPSKTGANFIPLYVDEEGKIEPRGGEQTNPNDGVVDKMSNWLSKGEIGLIVEAFTPPSTTVTEFALLDVNDEGEGEPRRDDLTNLNDGVVDKLSGGLSKGETVPTVEALTAPSATGADFTPLDVNKEGREELLGGEQTDPNDGRMDKLSGELSKGEIGLIVEAITPPSTTVTDFAPLDVN